MYRSSVLKLAVGLALIAGPWPANASEPGAGAVTVLFSGLKQVGEVQVALFADEVAWKSTTKAVRSATLTITNGTAQANFDHLPPGQYGVMAYHDRNANKKLDTLPIGLPTEPYGFSNDARGTFGPPAWRKAEVTVPPGQTVVQAIRLK